MSVTEDVRVDAHELATRSPDGAPPAVFDLLSAVVEDISNHFVGYLLAGLGVATVLLPAVFLGMSLMFVGMLPGIAIESEGLLLFGMSAGLLAYLGLVVVVNGPLTAGMLRAMWHHERDGEALSFGSVFRHMRQDLGAVVAFSLLQSVLLTVGLMMCFLPALFVGLFTSLGLPAIAIHRLGAVDALKLSVGHVRDNIGWHLGFWGLGVGILIVAQNLPVVGLLLGTPLHAAYTARGYGRLFPEPPA